MSNLERKVDLLIEYILADTEEGKISCVNKLKHMVDSFESSVRSRLDVKSALRHMLSELGLPSSVKGYNYIVEAVNMIVNDPTLRYCVVNKVYADVAELADSYATRGSVERCIRHAIMMVFDRSDPDTIYRYFSNAYSAKRGVTTNLEFLCALADKFQGVVQTGGANEVD